MAQGPTITTIAARAGVSIASVSRVLNGLPTREETVRKVMAAADELGYVPNAVARSLKSNRTYQVAFAMADIGNPTYVAMVREIQPVLKAAGYRLVLHSTDGDVDDELDVLRRLGERYVDGLIISPLRGVAQRHLDLLTSAPAPVVVIGSVPEGTPVDNVRADSRAGVRLALEHLHGLGRRRIGLLNGPLDTVPGAARATAYTDALASLGLPYDPNLVEVGDFYRAEGALAARRLLERARPDALLCANDLIALGALDVLREERLRVPEDVALVGMDDTELATAAWPTLTSVGLGSAERGRRAAELLLDRLNDGAAAPRIVTVEPTLAVRASTEGAP
ncbi:LacI family DNA-binding transcriptional regulator [Actinoallomurus soli]|uniref:LacI family DNA-binding transcriptional regulator n=1 Tax=Actinoallomurus soli TaxID=2952535 RepID=UPI0020926E1D|nr:LacI family DNA-binding transcriptional regulator [Actinoallomurus soli]MCO5973540.1 LacI family transcriptional regulator [Actinoallomurus soli]